MKGSTELLIGELNLGIRRLLRVSLFLEDCRLHLVVRLKLGSSLLLPPPPSRAFRWLEGLGTCY